MRSSHHRTGSFRLLRGGARLNCLLRPNRAVSATSLVVPPTWVARPARGICSVVGGRESFDLRRPSFSRIFPKMLMTMISIVPTFTGSLTRGSTLVRIASVGSEVSRLLSVIFLIAVEEATVSDAY